VETGSTDRTSTRRDARDAVDRPACSRLPRQDPQTVAKAAPACPTHALKIARCSPAEFSHAQKAASKCPRNAYGPPIRPSIRYAPSTRTVPIATQVRDCCRAGGSSRDTQPSPLHERCRPPAVHLRSRVERKSNPIRWVASPTAPKVFNPGVVQPGRSGTMRHQTLTECQLSHLPLWWQP
jgi:ferredoxin